MIVNREIISGGEPPIIAVVSVETNNIIKPILVSGGVGQLEWANNYAGVVFHSYDIIGHGGLKLFIYDIS